MQALTDIAVLVVIHNEVGILLVNSGVRIPLATFKTAIGGIVPQKIMQQGPQHFYNSSVQLD